MNSSEKQFTLVTRKKKKSKLNSNFDGMLGEVTHDTSYVSVENVARKLDNARNLIKSSEQFNSFTMKIDECMENLKEDQDGIDLVSEIVCYGLGNFSLCYQSLHQLALLLELQSFYKVPVYVFDPVFSAIERNILQASNLHLIKVNEEGKRQAITNTIFFLPHCSTHLFNNVLWKNWNTLTKCIIIGNTHIGVTTNTPSSKLSNFWYFYNITPAIMELEIPNVFEYEDVFNDLAIHIFPRKLLAKLSDEILNYQIEPSYQSDDDNSEFIKSEYQCQPPNKIGNTTKTNKQVYKPMRRVT